MTYKTKFISIIIIILISLSSCTQSVETEPLVANENINIIDISETIGEEYRDYIGVWYDEYNLPDAKYSERYILSPDGSYLFAYDQKTKTKNLSLIYSKGNWSIVDYKLILEPSEDIISKNSKSNKAANVILESSNVKFVTYNKDSDYHLVKEISPIVVDKVNAVNKKTFFIDGKQFWHTEPNPTLLEDYVVSRKRILNSNIIPNSDNKIINKNILLNMDKTTLSLARNELFARHGLVFTKRNYLEYFNNMYWYKKNPKIKNNVSELNEIEKANLELILDYQDDQDKYNLDTLNALTVFNKNEKKVAKQIILKDLDNDLIKEKITVEYSGLLDNESIYCTKAVVTIEFPDKVEIVEVNGKNLRMSIKFADFQIYDDYIQIYFEDNSSEGGNSVFIIHNENTDKTFSVLQIPGLIQFYDGVGRIYTNYNYFFDTAETRNSYFSLSNGFIPFNKETLIGTELTFSKGVALMKDSFSFFLNSFGDKNYSDLPESITAEAKEYYIGIVSANTKMYIDDIVFDRSPETDSFLPDPWIKIITMEGDSGWFKIKK